MSVYVPKCGHKMDMQWISYVYWVSFKTLKISKFKLSGI